MPKQTSKQRARLELILSGVLARGFDRSYRSRDMIRVKCGGCDATVRDGLPIHEPHCSHDIRYTCRECGESHVTIEAAFYCCEDMYVRA